MIHKQLKKDQEALKTKYPPNSLTFFKILSKFFSLCFYFSISSKMSKKSPSNFMAFLTVAAQRMEEDIIIYKYNIIIMKI